MKFKTLQFLVLLFAFTVFPTLASAVIIDNMDAVANWNSQTGDGSTVTVSTATRTWLCS
jgi:hypothetical protein